MEIPEGGRRIIEICKERFADMFDNDMFGPFPEEFTPYSDQRLETLFESAIGRVSSYIMISGLNWDPENYPYDNQAAKYCLITSMTIEMILHFMRTYVEIPDTSRVGAPDIVRRDYLNRWQSVLKDYTDDLKQAAKKLTSDEYSDLVSSGQTSKVLVDYGTMNNRYMPYPGQAERPMVWWW